jgi:hypothetical protein
MSSKEMENHPDYSKGQHRGNVGEGQIHFRRDNIRSFDQYLSPSNELRQNIVSAYHRQKNTQ